MGVLIKKVSIFISMRSRTFQAPNANTTYYERKSIRNTTTAAAKLTMELAMKMNGLIFYSNKFAIDASFESFKFRETRQP